MGKSKATLGGALVEPVDRKMLSVVSGDFALVAERTASNAYLIHMLDGKQYAEYLADKDAYVFPEQPPNPEIAKLFGKLGNPGIWNYVKKEHYDAYVKMLDADGQFHDKARGGGEVAFRDFRFRNEITACDCTNEPFADDDTVVEVWCVDKKYADK